MEVPSEASNAAVVAPAVDSRGAWFADVTCVVEELESADVSLLSSRFHFPTCIRLQSTIFAPFYALIRSAGRIRPCPWIRVCTPGT